MPAARLRFRVNKSCKGTFGCLIIQAGDTIVAVPSQCRSSRRDNPPDSGMDQSEKRTNIYTLAIAPFAAAAAVWACVTFPVDRIDATFVGLAVVTIFFSGYLHIQLPKTKIHLTASDALIFLAFLMFGGQTAVLLALSETAYTSLVLRKKTSVKMRPRTVLINVSISVITAMAMVLAVQFFYGPAEFAAETHFTTLLWLLGIMALSQFLVNSVLVSAFVAIKTESSLWTIWNQYCLNALVLYLCGAFVAGVCRAAFAQINFFAAAAVIGLFVLVYLTYKRYTDDIKTTFAKAEKAERERAEQAERHVLDLEHYVEELERSSAALRESREKFRHAAFHDNLTSLPNRNQFVELIDELLQRNESDAPKDFAVLFLDLNRFKTLNDSLGHSVGDRLIVGVSKRLTELAGEANVVGRFSGDEFSIIVPEMSAQEDATELAARIANKLGEPFSLDGRQIFTSVAIGIAFNDATYDNAESIIRDADIAMYYAKELQKDYVIFDRKMHAKAVSLLDMETDLRFAVLRKEFEVYYQPIVSLDNADITGFEALVRWKHPKWGMVSPNDFIPVAESTGLVIPMTVQILRAACSQIVQWTEKFIGREGLIVSVNLSGKHFAIPGLVGQIAEIIDETGIDPANLRLEITESAVMENAENAIAMLERIKEIGVRISIDDFGTGYSSLSYLHRFPVDILKVDRSFVKTMEAGTENGEIVRTILALARALKLAVVAEGIESIHQFHQLRVLGCEYGQGYLFSRPLPVSDAEHLLADTSSWCNILPTVPFTAETHDHSYDQTTH